MSRRRRFVVALHELDRCFGGREEGGWWYDAGRPSIEPSHQRLVRVFRSNAKAKRYRDSLIAVAKSASAGARSLGSVLYSGGQFAPVMQRGEQPQPWPQRTPRWE